MHEEYANKNEYSDDILRSQLHVLLYKAYALYKSRGCGIIEREESEVRLLKAFKILYMQDFEVISRGIAVKLKK